MGLRKKIVAGNWKMNKTLDEAQSLVNTVVAGSSENNTVTKIFFPPAPFIPVINYLIKDKPNFSVGAQNCYHVEGGAFTGEISASAIASCGATHVIIGHSERREYFHETPQQLLTKIQLALRHNLTPVFCVGEKLPNRKSNHYFSAVKQQLDDVVFLLPEQMFSKLILAYEPVWAIGTGETATPDQAQEMHAFIRFAIEEKYHKEVADQISILYGGSCNAKNAKELFACPDVDGGLIGGASLIAEEFLQIANSF